MRNTLSKLIQNKKILILGFGREGQSSYKLLNEVGGFLSLTISDQNSISPDLITSDVSTITGSEYLTCLNNFDVVFKSPGIVLPKDISEYTCEITCQADLFMQVYGKQIIGVTGTKGKSTTSSLLFHILKESGLKVLFAGNIGIPVFNIIDEIDADTTIVIELSCHQLEYSHFAPHKSIFLNLYEDHLDHYGTFEKYCDAKKNIYRNQNSDDYLFCNPEFLPQDGDCIANIVQISTDCLPFKDFSELKDVRLRGRHNLLNVAFDYEVCKTLGVSDEQFEYALSTFEILPHRLEYAGTIDGIDYYDDSISTTVESSISAIKAIPNAGVILLGGMDRGIDYDPLANFLISDECPLDHIVLMYASGKVLENKLKAIADQSFLKKVHYVDELIEASDLATKCCPKGKAVILSPAAASYGYFKNFEERGNVFKNHFFGDNNK